MDRGLHGLAPMDWKKRLGRSGWDLLREAPHTMLEGVIAVDTIAGSRDEEDRAFDKALARAADRFAHNELIKTVVAHAQKVHTSGTHTTSTASPKQLLERLSRISELLARHLDSAQADEFFKFLVDLGWTVARASSESPFGGSRVSVEEEKFLYAADHALRSGSGADVA